MSGSAPIIIITEKQQSVLSEFAVSRTLSVSLAQRSKIVLMAFDRVHNDETAVAVGLNRNQVGVWRHRWKAAFYDLVAVDCPSRLWNPHDMHGRANWGPSLRTNCTGSAVFRRFLK